MQRSTVVKTANRLTAHQSRAVLPKSSRKHTHHAAVITVRRRCDEPSRDKINCPAAQVHAQELDAQKGNAQVEFDHPRILPPRFRAINKVRISLSVAGRYCRRSTHLVVWFGSVIRGRSSKIFQARTRVTRRREEGRQRRKRAQESFLVTVRQRNSSPHAGAVWFYRRARRA